MDITADPRRLRGRGALSNAVGRYERQSRVLFDDGWNEAADEAPPPLKTEVLIDSTRTIIARNNSPDISFQQSINPYRGCEHGCIYCFARPTHAYLGFSPGADFESKLFAKPDAAKLLAKELSHPTTCPRCSPSAPTPIPISRSKRRCASCAAFSRCCSNSVIRLASSPSPRS
ncbi:MAG TPA: hypothetical protein VGG69_03410 [Rhizomicrobium sp.]